LEKHGSEALPLHLVGNRPASDPRPLPLDPRGYGANDATVLWRHRYESRISAADSTKYFAESEHRTQCGCRGILPESDGLLEVCVIEVADVQGRDAPSPLSVNLPSN
jgi:hypothetical protein